MTATLEGLFEDDQPSEKKDIAELIKRRRYQMIYHSIIYYKLNDNIISDHQFDAWAKELAQLLKDHPDAYSDQWDEYFVDFDGSTGYNLPMRHPRLLGRAQALLEYHYEKMS